MYSGLAARASCLSQDRSDIQYAVRELSRMLPSPTVKELTTLDRVGRYLMIRSRMLVMHKYQTNDITVHVWSDSDRAGVQIHKEVHQWWNANAW